MLRYVRGCWKLLKDFFGILRGLLLFITQVFEVANRGLQEVNKELEQFNQDFERKLEEKQKKNAERLRQLEECRRLEKR